MPKQKSNFPTPIAFAGGPYVAVEGVSIQLSGSGEEPNDGKIPTFEWDLDFDGNTSDVDAATASPEVIFADSPGIRTIGLRVRDNGSVPLYSAVSTTEVEIANAAPVIDSNLQSVTGVVLSTIENSGSWSDVASDIVSLTTNFGSVVKGDDGS